MIEIKNIIKELPVEASLLKPDFNRPITDEIVVHHSGPEGDAEGDIIRNLHNIAAYCIREKWYAHSLQYHYSIDREGIIYYCVDDRKFLPHCSNLKHNWRSISVCLLGNGDNSTDIQMSRLAQLVGYLKQKYGKVSVVTGHRDYINTYCPSSTIYQLIPNLNNISESETIMEIPYKAGDLILVDTGRDTLGYRIAPKAEAELLAVTGLGKLGRLPSKTKLEIIGGSVQEGGYLWMDVSVRPSFPEEANFGTGWIAVKEVDGTSYTKLWKSAKKAAITTAQSVLDEIKVKRQERDAKEDEIKALYIKLDKLID